MLKRLSDDDADTTTLCARNAGLDVLRGGVALLVVAHHAAITYGGAGDWFYREIMPSKDVSSLILTLFCAFNQAWFMGLFFLLAGYFTPNSVARRGAVYFMRERFTKLGLPLLVFGYVVGPATVALGSTARDANFFTTLFNLWGSAIFVLGPPWFCWALLLFSAGFLFAHATRPRTNSESNFPSNGVLLAAALATGLTAFALRLAVPVGKTVLGLQLGYFASYVLLFGAGCLACHARLLSRIPPSQTRLWGIATLVALPVLPLAIFLPKISPALAGDFNGGWTLPALVYAFWEPFVAWGVILVLLSISQRLFAEPGWMAEALARRAYAIFLIHPPVVVGLSLLLRSFVAPALMKFAIVASLSSAACFLLAGLLLRMRAVARVI